jgi:hypothetical protein
VSDEGHVPGDERVDVDGLRGRRLVHPTDFDDRGVSMRRNRSER